MTVEIRFNGDARYGLPTVTRTFTGETELEAMMKALRYAYEHGYYDKDIDRLN